jgi:hypothetical protein
MRLATLASAAIACVVMAGCGDEPDPAPAEDAAPVAAEPAGAAGRPGSAPLADGSDHGSVPIEITAVVGGQTYSVAGNGECTHTAEASIYDVRAAQWRASYSAQAGDLRSLNLTIWQPASGGADQANLSIRVGEKTHRLATVAGGEIVGSGIASASRSGDAGTLTVDGRDGDGTPVRVSVDCDRFDAPVAEGG